jgi:hypothetical protein
MLLERLFLFSTWWIAFITLGDQIMELESFAVIMMYGVIVYALYDYVIGDALDDEDMEVDTWILKVKCE